MGCGCAGWIESGSMQVPFGAVRNAVMELLGSAIWWELSDHLSDYYFSRKTVIRGSIFLSVIKH
jgi:hypothetical protein